MSICVAILICSFNCIHYGPGVDSAPNRKEYQVYFLGGKFGRYVWLTLPSSCAFLMKYRELNFLEHSGPLQACKRTDLIFLYYILYRFLCCTFHGHYCSCSLGTARNIFVLCLSNLYKFPPCQLCSWHKFSLQWFSYYPGTKPIPTLSNVFCW